MLNDWLASRPRTGVHEAGLLDLCLEERLPARLAIIAIQPFCVDWGAKLSRTVAAVVPKACATTVVNVGSYR